MVIGVPQEMKDHEFRVALTPNGTKTLCGRGHRVLVENGAGEGSGFDDLVYQQAGATIVPSAQQVFGEAELIIKVKEPQPDEWVLLTPHHVLFAYLHLASSKKMTEGLLKSGCTAIAYESTEDGRGQFPLLRPMSEIAGRMSVQIGGHFLEKLQGGSGTLLGGIPGVPPAEVVVLGSGVVGAAAVRIAVGMGAKVTVLSLDHGQLRYLDDQYHNRIVTIASSQAMIEEYVGRADLVIGAVYLPAARTPRIITKNIVSEMKPGSVIIDVSIDQGGCAETSRPTTHTDPVVIVDGVLHYGVSNIPGIVPHTATYALTNATLPFIVQLVEQGLDQILTTQIGLRKGVSILKGQLTNQAVGDAHGLAVKPLNA